MLEQNLSDRIKQFKKIDAHSHVGYFGSWCDVGITPEELIAQMDEYNVEKSVICTYPIQDSLDAVDKYPDRLVGAAWLNPMDPNCLDILKDAVKNHNFKAVKLHPLEQAYCPNDECVFPIAELAQKLEIDKLLDKYPYEVSGGQKQRAAVARALITKPQILLADEPTGALDSRASDRLLRIFADVNKEGQTILMVTHSIQAASRAGRVMFIKDGCVFNQIYRGGLGDDEMYRKISDTLTVLQTHREAEGKEEA